MQIYFYLLAAICSLTYAQKQKEIDLKWRQKITFVSKNKALKILKETASEMGLRIFFQIPYEDYDLFYEAENKELNLVIIEICEMLNLKVIFNDQSAHISQDQSYAINYQINALLNTRYAKNITNLDSSNYVQSEISIDFFKELTQNLEMLNSQFEDMRFFINRQSGLVYVYATQKAHKIIANYIDQMLNKINQQVLIEAKFMEIVLFQEYSHGIEWKNSVFNDILSINNNVGEIFTCIKANFLDCINYLEKFGKITTIANPRIIVTHNTPGVFKTIDNHGYFDTKHIDTELVKKQNINRIHETQFKNIESGINIMINLISSNEDGATVALKISIIDQNGEIINPIDKQSIPLLKIKNIDTIITVKNDEIVCIGGSYNQYNSQNDQKKLPWLFSVFSNQKQQKNISKETVIMLKAKNITYNSSNQNLDLIYLY